MKNNPAFIRVASYFDGKGLGPVDLDALSVGDLEAIMFPLDAPREPRDGTLVSSARTCLAGVFTDRSLEEQRRHLEETLKEALPAAALRSVTVDMDGNISMTGAIENVQSTDLAQQKRFSG